MSFPVSSHQEICDFQAEADKLTEEAEALVWKLRQKIGNKIREEILLPFCKRNGLTMELNLYGNTFTDSFGDVWDSDDIGDEHPEDPQAHLIKEALAVQYYGDHIFDCGLGFDIDKEDIE